MKHLLILIVLISAFHLFSGLPEKNDYPAEKAAKNSDPFQMIEEGQSLLKEGDLVLRLNRDPLSQYIKNFSRHDKRFSHAGIVLYEHGYPYVFHIVNGVENPDEKLRIDSLSHFCGPRKNMAWGIYRYEMDSLEIKKLREVIHDWYQQGLRFDTAFNLKTDDRMYCSEMISKALRKATSKRITIQTTTLTNREAQIFSVYCKHPVSYTSRLQLVAIDELYTNRFCHLVKNYTYDH
jgi:Permuted papain-like amidase enzyme, YaeF/YiiX, C92 family